MTGNYSIDCDFTPHRHLFFVFFASARASYGILRDNLPPSPEYSATDDDDLLLRIASSIERRLYRAAISPRAYLALSTLEFRITALATAVLIHSDYDGVGCEDDSRTVSSMCARLSAAARRSLSIASWYWFPSRCKYRRSKQKVECRLTGLGNHGNNQIPIRITSSSKIEPRYWPQRNGIPAGTSSRHLVETRSFYDNNFRENLMQILTLSLAL